jgi:hypothetical protein
MRPAASARSDDHFEQPLDATILVVGAAWPEELSLLLAADGLEVVVLNDVTRVPAEIARRRVPAVLIGSPHMGLKDWLAIHEVREQSRDVILVLSTTARTTDLDGRETELEAATIVVSWPPDTNAVHRLVRQACRRFLSAQR